MFGRRYFAPRYFGGRYFGNGEEFVVVVRNRIVSMPIGILQSTAGADRKVTSSEIVRTVIDDPISSAATGHTLGRKRSRIDLIRD